MIRHRIEGENFAGLGAEVLAELQPRAEAAVNQALQLAHAKAVELLGRPGLGRRKSSEAGRPPALRRGVLRRSLKIRKATTSSNVIFGFVYTNHPGAGAHEYGGRVGRNKKVLLPPRAYLRPAFEMTADAVNAVLENL